MQEDCIPFFPRGVRLQHDTIRQQWIIQAPERAFVLDETAQAILQLVDGKRSLGTIIDLLATQFQAPRTLIAADVMEMMNHMHSLQTIKL